MPRRSAKLRRFPADASPGQCWRMPLSPSFSTNTPPHTALSDGAGKAEGPRGPVWSTNEWDPLEEVILGSVAGARMPHWDVAVQATMPASAQALFREQPGRAFPPDLVERAEAELDGLQQVLERHGVTVRRPAPVDHGAGFATPEWDVPAGLYSAMPRDCLLVVGDQIIEAPMAWRSRYFETFGFRPLLNSYFREGARWLAAPKPMLSSAQFVAGDEPGPDRHGSGLTYAVTEHEPTFDAADFVRCDSEILGQRSHVTNRAGIEWLRRHLGPDVHVHVLEVRDAHPMHIDATVMPLAPGKLLVNPTRIGPLPAALADWEPILAPYPQTPPDPPLYMTSPWLSVNVLSLDPRRVLIEEHETSLAELLHRHGFEPILVPLRAVYSFGGSFHCVTLDVRRRPPTTAAGAGLRQE